MPTERSTQSIAVELFQELGMSQYESASYVALLQLGEGTAREISETTDVPRTRIYDSIDRLQERGLVDVQHASTKVFRPVARETALRHFRTEYDNTFSQLADRLAALTPVDTQHEQSGVWTTTGRTAVDDRIEEFLAKVTDEVVYLTIDRVLTDEILAELHAACQRGVTVRLANTTDAGRERLQSGVPGAEIINPPWMWDGPPPGRLLLTDREAVLMSTMVSDDGADETAIWGTGRTNSLVAVLTTIVTWWLETPLSDWDGEETVEE